MGTRENLKKAISRQIGAYRSEDISLEALQRSIEMNAGALDNQDAELRSELAELANDLELILYTLPLPERRTAALERISRVHQL